MAIPTNRNVNVLSVCSGIGGLDLGLRDAFARSGFSSRVVCYIEREAYASAVLVARMEEGRLDPAPIWSDLHGFDPLPWRGRVDCVSGGYPCQPFSQAGRRLGAADPRHLWPRIREILAVLRPRFVAFENVSGHVSLGLDVVLGDLQGLGYRVAATLRRAEESGAPHRRERIWIGGELADDDDAGRVRITEGGV